MIAFFMIFSFTACEEEDHTGEARTPAEKQKGENYEDVVSLFENQGFTNVKARAVDDLIVGWKNKDGEVSKVSVDGDKDYVEDGWYKTDAPVVITYHTFPKEEKKESVKKKEKASTEDEKEDKSSVSEDSKTESSKSNDILKDESDNSVENQEILTADNNPELAAVFSVKDENDPIVKAFAEKYEGRTIAFDGYIFESYKHVDTSVFTGKQKVRDSLYDVFLELGNYEDGEETLNHGPNLKMKTVPVFSFPEVTDQHRNIHVVATVKQFNEDNKNVSFFMLDPISIEAR